MWYFIYFWGVCGVFAYVQSVLITVDELVEEGWSREDSWRAYWNTIGWDDLGFALECLLTGPIMALDVINHKGEK